MRIFGIFVQKCKVMLLIITCLSLLSCYVGKRAPLHQLEELTEEIRLHHEDYSTADWKDAYTRYEQIAAEMENYQYSSEEDEKIARLEGECVGYFLKYCINSLDGFGNEIKGFVEGLDKAME